MVVTVTYVNKLVCSRVQTPPPKAVVWVSAWLSLCACRCWLRTLASHHSITCCPCPSGLCGSLHCSSAWR